MKDYNSYITNKEIQYLLKCRLIEEVEDDLFTQKQIDMETNFILNNEATVFPSIEKEKIFIKKLTQNTKTNNGLWKWGISLTLIVVISVYFVSYFNNSQNPKPEVFSTYTVEKIKNDTTYHEIVTEKRNKKNKITPIENVSIQLPVLTDSIVKTAKTHLVLGDAGIRGHYQIGEMKPAEIVDYSSIPVIPILTKQQIEENNKKKQTMLKWLKKGETSGWVQPWWVRIPASTDTINGETVSVASFYISTKEVTNWEYRVFLNDLIIHGKTDEYLKAVPDTTKWNINSASSNDPMVKNYFWHPAYNEYPVVNVSRDAAQMYCNWLTIEANEKIKEPYKKSGKEVPKEAYMNDVRLPSVSEWIIAARGGNSSAVYPWPIVKYAHIDNTSSIQNTRGCYLCNFWASSNNENNPEACSKKDREDLYLFGSSNVNDGAFHTANVWSYLPNNFRICNMAGNAAEMVINDKTKQPQTKGGSWYSSADNVKINAAPEHVGVITASPFIGFRPVFTAPANK